MSSLSLPSPRVLLGLLALLLGTSAQAAPEPVVERLSLEQALARFREDSPTSMQLAGRVAEARSTVRLASASALPVLAAQGGYTRNNAEAAMSLSELFDKLGDQLPVAIDTSGFPDDLIIQPLEQWSAGASVTVPLVSPQAWSDIGAARKGVEAAELGTEAARQQAEAGLVKAAWLTRAAEQRVAAAEHAEEAAVRHRDSAASRVSAGTGTELELLVAQTEHARRTSERLQAEADLDAARRAMGALIGVAGPVEVVLGDQEPAGSTLQAGQAAHLALGHRADLASAQAMVEASRRSQRSARLRHLPTVSGTAAAFVSDVPYPTGEREGWRLGLTATWVLYDGGARYGLLDRSSAQGLQARASVAQLELDSERQARDAVAALAVARVRLDLATQGAETARRAEASAERLYGAGIIDHLDAIDVVQRRLEAELALAGATAQVGVAQADLDLATGQAQDSR